MLKRFFLVFSFLLVSLMAKDIEITNLYARGVPPGISNSAAYLTIKNNTNKDILLSKVSSKIAKMVQMHKTVKNSNGMMRMVRVDSIKIPAKSSFEFKPGKFHIMLMGLNHKLKINQKVDDFVFTFSNGKTITIKNATVKTVMGGMKMGHK